MKTKLIILFLAFSSQLCVAQYTQVFKSFPDSLPVYMNGQVECHTPCKVRYYWRDKVNGKISFEIKGEGYKDWVKVITEKPMDFDDYETVYLDKEFENLDLKETPQISFDKILVDFKDGRNIGSRNYLKAPSETIEWSGSMKVGDESYEKKFFEISTNMGFNNIVSQSSKLFSDEMDNQSKLPKYIIGVEIIDYKINYQEIKPKRFARENFKSKVTIDFNWHVLDRQSETEVLEVKNSASFKSRDSYYSNSYNTEVFELALIDFLSNEDFIALLKKGEVEYERKAPSKSETILPKVKLPSINSTSELVKVVNPSCVTIITDGGHGSGVIVSKEGLLLSAYHVVKGVNKINVKFSSGLILQAEIVAFDDYYDIALLNIIGEGFSPLPLQKGTSYDLGTEVITIGTPADIELGQSISKGILSGKRNKEKRTLLQIDMSVSPGNSGGPLINEKGELVGIIQTKMIGSGIEGIGFAIPIDKVKEILNLTVEKN